MQKFNVRFFTIFVYYILTYFEKLHVYYSLLQFSKILFVILLFWHINFIFEIRGYALLMMLPENWSKSF